jgi:hypothetical protein
MAKKSCQLLVHSLHAPQRTFPVSQTGWHDALTHASEIARQNPGNLWTAHVDMYCGSKKNKVAMYKCRREGAHRPVATTSIPPLVHCELDVTRPGTSRAIAGRRRRR